MVSSAEAEPIKLINIRRVPVILQFSIERTVSVIGRAHSSEANFCFPRGPDQSYPFPKGSHETARQALCGHPAAAH